MIQAPKVELYNGQAVNFMQPKLDGHLAIFERTETGAICRTRTRGVDLWNELVQYEHRDIYGKILSLPTGSVIVGELHNPKAASTLVKTMLHRECEHELQFTPFALPKYHVHDLRETTIGVVMQTLARHGFGTPKVYPCKGLQVVVKDLHELAKKLGLEGWVLKVGHFKGWYKVVADVTIDAFVTSVETSMSANTFGELGALYLGVYEADGVTVRSLGKVGTGFKKKFRASIRTQEDRAALINRVVKVKCRGLAGQGKLRFPSFVCFREDKPKEQCTVEQLEN